MMTESRSGTKLSGVTKCSIANMIVRSFVLLRVYTCISFSYIHVYLSIMCFCFPKYCKKSPAQTGSSCQGTKIPGSLGKGLISSAVDAAKEMDMEEFVLLFVLIIIKFMLMVMPEVERNRMRPQSAEGKPSEPDGVQAPAEMQQENIYFDDAHPGYQDSRGEVTDPLRQSTILSDTSLQDFFSRPIKIKSYDWSPGTTSAGTRLDVSFNPWTLYFSNPRVTNRMSNYRLLKATLHVKFVLNGNSFYYGRLMASYRPLHKLDNTTLIRPANVYDIVEASQRPHVYMNPTLSQGGEMVLPFFTPQNLLDITASEWDTMGEIALVTLAGLKHANAGTSPVTITVFAWAEQVELSILTQTNAGDIVPQSKEEYDGIVSKPASVVAKVAGALTKIPVIAPYATATEIGAKSIASMAALFGFSKPPTLDIPPLQPVTNQSMAVTDGRESLLKLSVDTKQELSIDPKICGIDCTHDELSIQKIACRESYLTNFTWTTGDSEEKLLWNAVVDPCLRAITTSAPIENHLPACCFAAVPFQYWKGTMRFRFQIVTSQYHKGRIRFVYDPVRTANGLSEYNVVYSTIVDISEDNDFCLDIGWGQKLPFREHLPFSNITEAAFMGTSVLNYTSSSSRFGNGTLSAYIVNKLTTPADGINNDITINVFVSMVDDFEVAAPTHYYMDLLSLSPDMSTTSQSAAPPRDNAHIVPHSAEGAEEKQMNLDTMVMDPETINLMGPKTLQDPIINRIHFGESIASFRTLLKRKNLTEVYNLNSETFQGSVGLGEIVRPMFPLEPGYTAATSADTNVLVDIGTAGYCYSRMTLMNYLVRAFGGWRGGIRYTTDATFNLTSDTALQQLSSSHASTWSVARIPTELYGNGSRPLNVLNHADTSSIMATIVDVYGANKLSLGHGGVSRWNTAVNPVQSYEVPFYSNYRFAPARRGTVWTSVDIYQPSYVLTSTHYGGILPYLVFQYVSCAEDFTLMFYLSPPIFYTGVVTPTPP